MKIRILKPRSAAIFVASLVAVCGLAQKKSDNAVPDEGPRLTVMNPAVENKLAERLPLAPRLDTLQGKTVYLIDINWGGPEAALSIFEEMQSWFAKNLPGVKTIVKIKKGGYEQDDPALWKEISEKRGDAAILGVSG
jgi:hypothetical protein